MSSFTTPLRVEVLDDSKNDHPLCRVLESFVYRVRETGEEIRVPVGFETDWASIPWGLWNFEPPFGRSAKAAVVHDFLYATKGTGVWGPNRYIERAEPYTRAEADDIFRQAMGVLGVPLIKRRLMWSAVRLGGWKGWGD